MGRILSYSGFVLALSGLCLMALGLLLFVQDPNKSFGFFEGSKVYGFGSCLMLLGIIFGLRSRDFEEKR